VSAQLGQLLRAAGLAAGDAKGADGAAGYHLAQKLARLQLVNALGLAAG